MKIPQYILNFRPIFPYLRFMAHYTTNPAYLYTSPEEIDTWKESLDGNPFYTAEKTFCSIKVIQ
jgi:hypothetical protein